MNNQNTLHIGNIGHTMPHNTDKLLNARNLHTLTVDSIEFIDNQHDVNKIKFQLGDLVYTFFTEDRKAFNEFKATIEVVKRLTGNGALLTNQVFKELLEFALVESVLVNSTCLTMTDKYTISRDKFPNIWERNLINTPHNSTGNPPLNIIGNGGGYTSKSDPNMMLCGGAS